MTDLIFCVFSSIVTFFMAFFLTMKIRSYALEKNMIDHPNERTSHEQPTPRGGGASVVISFLVGLGTTYYFGVIPFDLTMAICLGSLPIAVIGFWDDHGHVDSKWRLLVQFIVAGICVYLIGGIPGFYIGSYYLSFGIFKYPIAILLIVWLINLTNFMDGIDGIASIEAISFGFVAAVLLFLNTNNDLFLIMFIFIAACMGFLVWNWPPAKIFMGDVCSGFIGYIFSVFVLYKSSGASDSKTFIPFLLILGVFVVDATQTLIIRAIRGEKILQPHRIHAYQHASRKYSHLKVTGTVLAINLLILAPVSCLCFLYTKYAVFMLILAYLLLALLSYRLKSGLPES